MDGERALGPGVLDMKGGLVVGIFALRALHQADLLDRVAVRGIVVGDEEVGSPASQPTTVARVRGAAVALGLESGRGGDSSSPGARASPRSMRGPTAWRHTPAAITRRGGTPSGRSRASWTGSRGSPTTGAA